MNKGNQDVNDLTLEFLDIQPHHHVLDLGFGGGLTFPILLGKLKGGKLYGLEMSRTMVEQAAKKYARNIGDGKLEVKEGVVDRMGFGDGQFDRILTVNTVYFWPNLGTGFKEIARVLKPGGKVGLGYRSKQTVLSLGYEKHGVNAISESDVEAAAREAGLTVLETRSRKGRFDDRATIAQRSA
ncbi:class I SAM-dependent methyltransferase [Sorangium sp. So ce388]|uniref:class I SAM-dependent methyltransferase n=1 Tax=Sorangium sp. So ce388 TaxID=3133309 RepID=UPI003F5BFA79